MPRQRKVTVNLGELQLNRTVGLEIEGYMKSNPRDIINSGGIRNASIKRDGSLSNYNWMNPNRLYGVEVVTVPIGDLTLIDEVFEDILKTGWSASGRAGLHIHVDTNDFNFGDKMRAAHFAKAIEDVMFLFVKNRRYRNRYCHMLPAAWNTLLDETGSAVNMNEVRGRYSTLDTDKYNWLNAFSSNYPTIEFRLFHPIRSAADGQRYAYLVHNFIELVKNSTKERLDFIAGEINGQADVESKAKKFLEALSIPFNLPVISERATVAIEAKMPKQIIEAVYA